MPFGTIEHDNLVAASPPHQPFRILFARAFDQDLHLLANQIFVMSRPDFIHNLKQSLVAIFFYFLRHLTRHGCRGRITPRRVFENIGLIKFHFAHQG